MFRFWIMNLEPPLLNYEILLAFIWTCKMLLLNWAYTLQRYYFVENEQFSSGHT